MTNLEKVNYLISKYDFPQVVVEDVDKRITDCRSYQQGEEYENNYISQQVRYLERLLKSKGIIETYS